MFEIILSCPEQAPYLPRSASAFSEMFSVRSTPVARPACGRIVSAVLFALLATVPALAQSNAGSAVLSGHTPRQVLDGSAMRVSHYNSDQKLRLALAVQAPHMAEEEQFIQELTTPGSPNFHKFLNADEWNARFAPSAEDEQKVVDWAQSQGLTVTHRYANRLLVDVEGTSRAIETAFGVTINNYRIDDDVDFSNDRDPVVPASLSGILHSVLGLNNIERVHRAGSGASTPKGPDYVAGPAISEAFSIHLDGDPTKAPESLAATMASSPTPADSFPLRVVNGTYAASPNNIQSSEGYDYNALQRLSHCCNVHNDPGGSPAVSSIALVGYGNFNASDVKAFFNYYGMAANVHSYYINGTGFPAVDGEAPLDVEYAGAMANSYGSYLDTAAIYEYEMPNNLYATYADAFNQVVSDDHAKVVSTSYGWEENVGFSGTEATGTMHPIFNSMVGTGWTLIAASGDNGATTGCTASAVSYPASDPDFLAAGGTELLLNDSGIFQSEAAWTGDGSCAKNHGGGGGGVSVLFSAPSWQNGFKYEEWSSGVQYTVSGNTKRKLPDISLTANPDIMGEWYYAGGSWQSEGGTSIVAPELAGFFAQFNTYLNYIGNICGSTGKAACTPAGLATPFIYDDGITGAAHYPFYDTTSGCNSNSITGVGTAENHGFTYFCAEPGFDLATGWGSANMLQLAWGINYNLIPAYGAPVITFSGPATNTWYHTNQRVSWTVKTINTRPGGTTPPPGVAGFTQGWDSIPADPHSEPHGGTGNSFYSGPQYAFATSGCLDFAAAACATGSGQGCHTVKVEAWDNQGDTAIGSYGPICYDTIAPTTTALLSGTKTGSGYTGTVTVTLTAVDKSGGSGVASTIYQINGGSPLTYTLPIKVNLPGNVTITYHSVDKAGNAEANKSVSFTTPPAVPTLVSPKNGTIAPLGTKSGTLKWNAVSSATSYTAQVHTGSCTGTAFGSGYSGPNTSFTVSGLTNGTTYYWRVRATNGAGSSAFSGCFSFKN